MIETRLSSAVNAVATMCFRKYSLDASALKRSIRKFVITETAY